MDSVKNKIAKLIAFIGGEDLENARKLLIDIVSDELAMRGMKNCNGQYELADVDDEDMDDEDDEEYCVECNECGFEFIVSDDEIEDVKRCPKCGSNDLLIDKCKE